jgi:putative transposase
MRMHPLEGRLRLPANFQAFNPRTGMRVYQRNLPHWRQPGATYFLTFRLGDSVPEEVIAAVQRERHDWEQLLDEDRSKHGENLPQRLMEDYQAFLVQTYRRLEKVMDAGHGSCVLGEPRTREIVSEAMLCFHRARYEMHGFVVMPNHAHLCVRPLGDWELEKLLHSWKSFTATEINKRLGRTGTLWQEDSWDRIVRDDAHWFRAMRYILRNPDHAKLLRGQSTVWVDSDLLDHDSSTVREGTNDEDPW